MAVSFNVSSSRRTDNRIKIGIRVDYSPAVTAEPVNRCLAIAQQLKKQGCQVIFISADSNIVPYVSGTGFACHMLGSDWRELEMEADSLIEYMEDEDIDELIIDQVHVTPEYFAMLREAGIKLCYIDRRVKFPYDTDILINYSPAPQLPDYKALYAGGSPDEPDDTEQSDDTDTPDDGQTDDPESPGDDDLIAVEDIPDEDDLPVHTPSLSDITLLTGIEYLPMTQDYVMAADGGYLTEKKPIPNIELPADPDMASESVLGNMQTDAPIRKAGLEPVRDIFFTLAGADTSGMTEKFITGMLKDPELHEARIHLFCGMFFRITEKLQILIEDGRVFLHHEGETDVPKLICMCDAAVSPAEPLTFEICACGCPFVTFYFTDEQGRRADYLKEAGAASCAGDYRDDWKKCIQETIRALHEINRMGTAGRWESSIRMKKLIDGHGAERIAEAVIRLREG